MVIKVRPWRAFLRDGCGLLYEDTAQSVSLERHKLLKGRLSPGSLSTCGPGRFLPSCAQPRQHVPPKQVYLYIRGDIASLRLRLLWLFFLRPSTPFRPSVCCLASASQYILSTA